MILYAESSAVLAWLLGESAGSEVRKLLSGADRVIASALTGVECSRALARARAIQRITAAEELAALRLLDVAESAWDVHDVSEPVLSRARAGFPREPVRTLDAIHLATAVQVNAVLGGIGLLSLDDQVRTNAALLGIKVVPPSASRSPSREH